MVTVARTFTKLVDEDFGWKDPKAIVIMLLHDCSLAGVRCGYVRTAILSK
jgi:hypothetical protein